jgi:hypothetical protein
VCEKTSPPSCRLNFFCDILQHRYEHPKQKFSLMLPRSTIAIDLQAKT